VGTQNKTAVGLILIVVISLFVLLLFGAFTAKTLDNTSRSFSSGEIAVVEVEGVIMDSKDTIKKLLKAEKKEAKAIIMRINSPGGAVGPTQEIYEEIVRIDKKIPVYASFGVVAASGGYYIGSACREIYANAGTLTGSIGVIMKFMNLSKLYEFAKVKERVIKAGKYKDIGSPSREMTLEENRILQSTMDIVHHQFISDIEKRRKSKINGNLTDLAQGQIFSGEEALKLGLVDKLGSLWTLGRDIHKNLKLDGEFKLNYIEIKKDRKLSDILQSLDSIMDKIKMSGLNKLPLFLFE
jgi:protease-4